MSNNSDNSSVDDTNKMEADSADNKRKAVEAIDPRPTKAQKVDNNSPTSTTNQNKGIEVIDLENAQSTKSVTNQPAPTKSDESPINPNLAMITSLLNNGSLPEIKNKTFKGSIFDFGEFFGVIDGPHSGTYVLSICLQDQVFTGVVTKNPSVSSAALKELIQKQAPEISISQPKADTTISFNNKNANNDSKSPTPTPVTSAPATSTANTFQIPPLSSLTDTAAYGEQATRAALSALSGQSPFGRTGAYPYGSQDESQLMQQQMLYAQMLQSYQLQRYQQQQAVQEYLQQQYQLQLLQQQKQQMQALKPIQPLPVPTATVAPAVTPANNNNAPKTTTSTLKSWTHSGPDKEKQVVFTSASMDDMKKKDQSSAIKMNTIKSTMTTIKPSDFEASKSGSKSGEKKVDPTKDKMIPLSVQSSNTTKFKESKDYLQELGFKIVQTILQQYYYQQIANSAGNAQQPMASSTTTAGSSTTTNTISIVNNNTTNTNGTQKDPAADPRTPIEIIDK